MQKGWLLWAWSCQHGTLSSQAPRLTTSTTTSRRTLRHRGWQSSRWPSLETNERVLWQGSHSIAFQRVTRLEWIQKSSAHCSSVASGINERVCRCGVSQTALAIIGLCVLSQVLWWRLLWHASVERAEQGSRPT